MHHLAIVELVGRRGPMKRVVRSGSVLTYHGSMARAVKWGRRGMTKDLTDDNVSAWYAHLVTGC